jgi:hypothetical protein
VFWGIRLERVLARDYKSRKKEVPDFSLDLIYYAVLKVMT